MIRILGIDLPTTEIAAFVGDDGPEWRLRATLGVASLDAKFVEVVDLETLRTYGFARYLAEAYGIANADLAADTVRLDGLTGHVALVMSEAFGGQTATLTLAPPLRHIGTFHADPSGTPTQVLYAETAKPQTPPAVTPKPSRSDAAIGGRIAMIALIGAAALVGLMIWIAG